MLIGLIFLTNCYQWFKDKKFESNSQLFFSCYCFQRHCYQWFKDKKFESNSQLTKPLFVNPDNCYQWFKDKKFESNSQLITKKEIMEKTVEESLKRLKP